LNLTVNFVCKCNLDSPLRYSNVVAINRPCSNFQ